MTVFAPASENAPWIPWSERDGYLWTVAIMSTSSTSIVRSSAPPSPLPFLSSHGFIVFSSLLSTFSTPTHLPCALLLSPLLLLYASLYCSFIFCYFSSSLSCKALFSFSCFTSFGQIQNIWWGSRIKSCAPPAGHQGPLLVILVHKVPWCTEIRPANWFILISSKFDTANL